ncbi:HAMP domain-containing histidine kinase [Catenulispora sp. NF23]|uniref:sensor histidine kinase n=1 Tax=Catenulispora pinistramenti TaxID=2705254 RepID=UPI001BA63FD5|nr:HAMP domain-containing sensor histidine kinase [Catenulispora pinistramenti]MBS2540022.1 HAMP domain-containing histidine kinase [Catenulispora pinistramenti]
MNPLIAAEHPESEEHLGPYERLRAKITEVMSHVPLRTRITALVMVAVGLSVALASIAGWVTVRNQILSQMDTTLSSHATQIAKEVQIQEDNQTKLQVKGNLDVPLYTDTEVVVFDSDGVINYIAPSTVIPSVQPIPADVAVAQAGGTASNFRTIVFGDGTKARAITVPVPPSEYSPGTRQALLLAQSMHDTQQTLSRLSLVSILVGIAGIAVAGSAGITVGRAGLRPVDRLTEATEYVARTGDLRPIEVQGTDELARLATSFNSMLTALARSQDHQRRLIADAGHELRTPLTSMRTNIDLLSQVFGGGESEHAAPGSGPPRISDADRSELIADVRAQMEELSVLVGDLVELSRDAKPQAAPEPVNLGDVVRQAVDRVRRRAPGLKFDIQLQPWFLEGDPAALERAVTNLLDNAGKWSPEDGTVTVRLADGLLQVSDQGPGIAEEDMPHVFERFYRSTEARTMPGSGLGLAIVRQAAENHGGRVAAARAPSGGALLGLWLPGRPTEDADSTSSGSAAGS